MATVPTTSTGNMSLTGVGTGIDWQSIVSQLTQASEQELVPYNNEISAYNTQISAWGTISSDLGSLQTAADTLASPTALDLFTANVSSGSSTSASSLLSATASSSAAPGSYSVVVNSVAQAEKMASGDFASQTSKLGLSGNFMVNDQTVSVSSTDTLQSLQTKINALDSGGNPSGVTASIVQDNSSGYRLVLTSDTTGAKGFSLLNGDNNNVLESLGFNGSGAATVKNQVTGAAQSDGLTSQTTSLASLLGRTSNSGTLSINGQNVTIDLDENLQQIASDLNTAGLSASVVSSTSGSTTGYSLQIAGSMTSVSDPNNVLGALGLKNGTDSAAGTVQSNSFANATASVASLSGRTSNAGTVSINGQSVTIDLDDNLQQIQSTLNSAGLSSSIVSSTSGSTTKYSLQIAGGINSFSDNNSVLQAMGFIQGDRTSETATTASTANTTDGSTPITAATPLTSIYGYNKWTSGDSITISGADHGGSAITPSTFNINQDSTVQDLLNAIQTAYSPDGGNEVTASVTSNGQIQVVDNQTGTSKLAPTLTPSISDTNSTLGFGTFPQAAALSQYVLQQGADASYSIDGINMTSSTNTVTNALPGVTLNLLGASPGTPLTLNVAPDTKSMETEINSMISAFNSVVSDINTQNTYNSATNTTGGPLFGDPTLNGLMSQLHSTILNQTGSSGYNSMAAIGITVGQNGLLSLDSSAFETAVASDFNAVSKVFQDSGTSSNPLFSYVSNTSSTKSGSYQVDFNSNSSGTIDGQTATVNGNSLGLSGTNSGANGLVASYSGSDYPDSSTITVNRGIASLLNDLVNSYTNATGGIVTTQTTGINSSITGIQKQETDMQNNITQQMQSLSQEYQNMNTAVAQLDQMQSYLTAQLASLNTSG